ncbi:hypothetical protein Y032_0028g1668 [Ancylostoma ceylanicum]|uniref:CUB domain-containing protein n=1 Tax=Ancylostoma ceylanicum TaxID=53326 RepID=A0A016UT34_9BILA|nr:hypothetical protein Y032_0028g1668 [Ancylostoma ceylanicum]
MENERRVEALDGWKTLIASAGDPNDWTATSTSTDCYWHIVAPPDRQIEFYLTSTPYVCMEMCPWQSLEINTGQFHLFGMIVCCPSLIGVIMTSQGNLVTIRGATRYNQVAFGVMYRLVPLASTSSTPPSTVTYAASTTTSAATGTTTVQTTTISGSPLNTTTVPSTTVGATTSQTTTTIG